MLNPLRLLCSAGALWVLALVAPAAAQTTSAPYVFSDRVGETVDPGERAYFGLFPDVETSAPGQAFVAGDSVVVVLARTSLPDTTVTMGRPTAEALGRFIETFEQHTTAFYNPDWQLVVDFVQVDVPVPYARRSKGATFFVDGGYHAGQITYASDSLLLLEPRGTSFDWRTFDGAGLTLRSSEVDQVQFAPGWLGRPYVVLAGVPLGIAVDEWLQSFDSQGPENLAARRIFAAAFGAAVVKMASVLYTRTQPYEEALPRVKEAARFSPEAQPLEMPSEAALATQAATAGRPKPTPRWYGSFGWLSLGTVSPSLSENIQTYDFFSGFDPEGDPQREVRYESTGALLDASAAVSPVAWLDLGAGVYLALDERPEPIARGPIPYAELRQVAYSEPSYRIFVDVDVLRLALGENRFGLEIGGGLLRAESSLSFDVSNVEGRAGQVFSYEPAGYEFTEAGWRPFYQATLDVGLAQDVSAFASLVAHSAPDVDVPQFEAGLDFDPDVTVFRVEPHTVSFRYLGLSAGVRLGF
jgi:hypothetical protein